MQLSCIFVATCQKLASVRAALQKNAGPMADDDCVVCTRPTQPKSRKISHSPAKTFWVTWLSQQTQLQYCHRVLGSVYRLLQEFANGVYM